MLITPANVGDIIRMDHQARHVQIEDVTEEYVHYRCEDGDSYATFDHELEGSIVQNRDRIQEFQRNASLGIALRGSEISALRSILDGTSTHEQMQDANAVLDSVKGMQKRLSERIALQNKKDFSRQSQHRSLDNIISRASATAQNQQQTGAQPVLHGHDR